MNFGDGLDASSACTSEEDGISVRLFYILLVVCLGKHLNIIHVDV